MRIGRLIFGVMLGVISMWFSHNLYASEHRVETMREFEQAWHLDEPDQTIRLEADIVDDIATGLEPRTQDVTNLSSQRCHPIYWLLTDKSI